MRAVKCPNDEFADFELVEQWIATKRPLTLFKGGYVRDAWRTGLEFQDKIVGGSIPRGLIPAVEKGVLEACQAGPLAGYPVVDVKVECIDAG